MTTGFDAYISLGDNCEPGLQFRRIGWEESSLFRFASAPALNSLRLIEADFEGLFLKENLIPATDDMVRDTAWDIAFYSGLTSVLADDGHRVFTPGLDMDAIWRRDKQKIDYLVDKWRRMVASSRKILYIYKRNHNGSRDQAEEIHRIFSQCYPDHDWTILYIQYADYREDDWGIDRLHNEYLPFLAPYENAHYFDEAGWDELFSRYPLKPGVTRRKQGKYRIPKPARDQIRRILQALIRDFT